MTLLGLSNWLHPRPASTAGIEEAVALPEYELEIVLRDGTRCIDPVPFSVQALRVRTSEGRREAAREWARGITHAGRVIEGPVNTFRSILPEDILTVTARERVE